MGGKDRGRRNGWDIVMVVCGFGRMESGCTWSWTDAELIHVWIWAKTLAPGPGLEMRHRRRKYLLYAFEDGVVWPWGSG
eukprot:2131026-Rhodomonas_salina.2